MPFIARIFENIDPTNSETWPCLLTTEECAYILRLSLNTIRTLTQSGKLRARRFGKQLRIRKEDLLTLTNHASKGEKA